ncbi:bifunctional UDP-sugar hydrolase/5'-nucleotidase [Vagococcus carniphilus]|uniref:Bifunctional UDP-sugar hydrolase/5'-nucleotidase n=1 Tax=Vagococcus carniphilus TaxID=218144 RepID=A0AAW8UAI1_9ENTE|nr:bifunctional UDP-sugar hydrolase/5'-nucleotidase [Vagococcus carniphilus]MDT2834010.1 bifunctional UDP-sugar hydrolase/5'-nucleotidase [Vagococcus carniphilus]
MKEVIHLLHTNDLHSHFENWPKIRRFVTEKMSRYEKKKEDYLLVDLGDFMDRYHPLTDATNGLANVEIMNQLPYDYVTIGNNEGITNSKFQLNRLYDDGNFQVVLSNLLDKETMAIPSWAKPYQITQTKQGTKIAVIGLTAPIELSYHSFGWEILDSVTALNEWLPEIKKEADVIVLLSHLGLPDDKFLAKTYPEIDVIVESHTHHLFSEGKVCNDVLLSAAGRFGLYVGEVELIIENNHVVSKQSTVYETASFKEKTIDMIEITNYQMKGENLLKDQTLGYLPETLTKKHTLMDLTLEAMKDYGGKEVSLLNTGIILTDLKEGVVTKKDLHECLPHPMNLIKVKLKGRDVKRLVYEIERSRDFLFKFEIVGMKFRGKYFGQMCYDGLTYCKKTQEVKWLNQEILDEKIYELITVDHLSFLPFFPTIEIAGEIEILSSDFLRTILGDYIKQKFSEKIEV